MKASRSFGRFDKSLELAQIFFSFPHLHPAANIDPEGADPGDRVPDVFRRQSSRQDNSSTPLCLNGEIPVERKAAPAQQFPMKRIEEKRPDGSPGHLLQTFLSAHSDHLNGPHRKKMEEIAGKRAIQVVRVDAALQDRIP